MMYAQYIHVPDGITYQTVLFTAAIGFVVFLIQRLIKQNDEARKAEHQEFMKQIKELYAINNELREKINGIHLEVIQKINETNNRIAQKIRP